MSIVGKVESLWRYPVKSMRGEELAEAFIGFAGVYGDRLFAFKSSARPAGFPYLTGREQEEMLLYRPRFRHPDKAAAPPNLAAAEPTTSGLSPLSAVRAELAVEVETPTGEVLDVEDPALLRMLGAGLRDGHVLTLLRSERALTDCRPVSLLSLADRAPARRRDRHGPRQATLPGERLPGSRLGGGLRRGSLRRPQPAGSARRRWSRCSSATRAAR